MNETYVTLRGNATEDPRIRTTGKGEAMITLRVASTRFRYDQEQHSYAEGPTNFVTVVAYRNLARHVATSVRKGDAVIVYGELQVDQWERDGRKGTSVEIKATTMGHDLHRGVSSFTRASQFEARRPPAPSVPAGSQVVDPARAETDEYVVAGA
ncbi:single-stranded DNA-binding protein [Mobilicoccus massiliensis]|uniref:single-stranded DNA-binding protein n=1 Tax=Mobilicoccus massiliensis TaxID=1522310 RepID=UPI00058E2075|nr:single-stranded DNA-binding protein [Mobilicoccus massiliensis]